jgi:hypothetical protein
MSTFLISSFFVFNFSSFHHYIPFLVYFTVVAKDAFSVKFLDPHKTVDQFIEYIELCHRAFLQPSTARVQYYSPFVTMHQSSMAGKSRTALEAMKRLESRFSSSLQSSSSSSFSSSPGVHCFYLNVRDEGTANAGNRQTAYPPAMDQSTRTAMKLLRGEAWRKLIERIRSMHSAHSGASVSIAGVDLNCGDESSAVAHQTASQTSDQSAFSPFELPHEFLNRGGTPVVISFHFSVRNCATVIWIAVFEFCARIFMKSALMFDVLDLFVLIVHSHRVGPATARPRREPCEFRRYGFCFWYDKAFVVNDYLSIIIRA